MEWTKILGIVSDELLALASRRVLVKTIRIRFYERVEANTLCLDETSALKQMLSDPAFNSVEVCCDYCLEYDNPENCSPREKVEAILAA